MAKRIFFLFIYLSLPLNTLYLLEVFARPNVCTLNTSEKCLKIDPIYDKELLEISRTVHGIYEKVFAEQKYGPGLFKVSGKLFIELDYNASYRQGGIFRQKHYISAISNQYLRRKKYHTNDSFVLTLCHEIGHALGGNPLKRNKSSSVEGQADFFATAICLKKVFATDNNKAIMEKREIPNYFLDKCSFSFETDSSDYYICLRSMMAAERLNNF